MLVEHSAQCTLQRGFVQAVAGALDAVQLQTADVVCEEFCAGVTTHTVVRAVHDRTVDFAQRIDPGHDAVIAEKEAMSAVVGKYAFAGDA